MCPLLNECIFEDFTGKLELLCTNSSSIISCKVFRLGMLVSHALRYHYSL
jgi:hypothetical protein